MTRLPSRLLGRTGLRVSALGVGTGALGADPGVTSESARDDLAIETLRCAIASGITYIDTSPSYRNGDSDRRVGLALREGWRDKVVLATKVGTHPDHPRDYSARAVTWTVEQSLEVLGADVLDVVLIHDPEDMDPLMIPGGALDALEALKTKGRIRAIGLGVQNHRHLRAAVASTRFEVIQSPYDHNLIRTTAVPLLDLAAARGVGFINASPFQQGLLAGINPDEIVRIRAATNMWGAGAGDVARAHRLWAWAAERGTSLRALALQFCLREPRIVTTLTGPRTPVEVLEDVEAAFEPIPDADWAALAEVLSTLPPASPGGEASLGAYPPPE